LTSRGNATELATLAQEIEACRRCPRLVAWREQVARERRAAFAHERYAGHPVAGFGDPAARVLILGLAPAAHGGNRTGRIFTGDRSGDFLFAALHRAGFANQPTSTHRGDGLRVLDAWVTAAVRCAPPANRPTSEERDACQPWSVAELELLADIRVAVCLGAFAWDAALRLRAAAAGDDLPRPRPRFGHGAEYPGELAETGTLAERGMLAGGECLPASVVLLGCFHPSQQNTFTGRLTAPMIDVVLRRARELAGLD
jgi:uracil-DNA glycosylase family 4